MKMIQAQNEEDERLLRGILNADRVIIDQVYKDILPSVIYWIKENSGTESEARDIFQEALIAVYKKLVEGNLELTCSLKSFMRIISRNLWMTRLRNRKRTDYGGLEDLDEVELDESIEEQIVYSEKEQLYFKYFDQLDEKCRNILRWFFDKVSLAEIAVKLDSSENYIKKRKFMCKEKLVKAIQADPTYLELIS